MTSFVYNICAVVLSLAVLYGISMMSSPKTATRGNQLGAMAMAVAIILTLIHDGSMSSGVVWISIAIGSGIGWWMAKKVTMLQMPQMVALLNGLGGAASALVAMLALVYGMDSAFARFNAGLALAIGMVTLTGSLVAAGKLHQVLGQRPVHLPMHSIINYVVIALSLFALGLLTGNTTNIIPYMIMMFVLSSVFGVLFTMRVGGADMPITISLLNSLSGVAGGIAGIAIADPLLVAVGGIVGASGLLLTQIMCRAMNRSLMEILLGNTTAKKQSGGAAPKASSTAAKPAQSAPAAAPAPAKALSQEDKLGATLRAAKKVVIVPGYGMALAQAQHKVKQLADLLESKGAEVKYAIHPVAGRMPGHMNVLLAEANVDYEQLLEMDAVNPMFASTDLVIIIGANDVVNPAANTAEGTPIYGMPILQAGDAKNIIVCNYDTKPGYAGVDNSLYTKDGVVLLLGDASETVGKLVQYAMTSSSTASSAAAPAAVNDAASMLATAKKVVIVPGYGMALAQAQHKVKQLADVLEGKGVDVKYAIHPVAGRMPGHMNVLLAEANVDYEQLLEMDAVNPLFASTDLVVIIGANDVVNPAANTAEGTPIYGMPILQVGDAKNVIVCNYDTKPGYAGVDNSLYTKDGVVLMLGDASETVGKLVQYAMTGQGAAAAPAAAGNDAATMLANAKKVVIVPGYGMALAQAQHKVKQLADVLEGKGVDVKYAIHPVAGRMPGHMNVLLAEANVDYEQLLEMDAVNPLFASTDLVVIIGANDVVNPAANTAEGTPIYGMPILRADEAKNVIICNYDTKPGYAGVENSLYTKDGVVLMLGDAAETVGQLVQYAMTGQGATPVTATAVSGNDAASMLANAKKVVIVPGYGMALAQAQHKVKQLADALESKGVEVKYAIHPVAGRMPGHMNVLLAEANVDYEQLLEMDAVNPLFASTDLVVIIGANDVVNPAANTAEGTPIYGMPILRADEAKNVIICNYDTKPGYAGVENSLYTKDGVILMLGDASETVGQLVQYAMSEPSVSAPAASAPVADDAASMLAKAKKVVIVPGYGMALAQAQHKVKQLADALESKGVEVKYAIHPVAGRMPGHMNVLLAEANVDYEKLLEMDVVNPLFPSTDLVIIIGANDVVNPAANTAEGTPIYGMPILRADEAKNVIICNYDTKPGYAGVENSLYTREGVVLMLGDASASLDTLVRYAMGVA